MLGMCSLQTKRMDRFYDSRRTSPVHRRIRRRLLGALHRRNAQKNQLLRSPILARRTFVGFLVSGSGAVYFHFADEGLFAIASSLANTCIRTALTATRLGCRPNSRTGSSNSGTAVITRSISARCTPHRSACPAALTIVLLLRTRTKNRATMAPTRTTAICI